MRMSHQAFARHFQWRGLRSFSLGPPLLRYFVSASWWSVKVFRDLVGAQKNGSGWSAIWWALRKMDLADPRFGGRSENGSGWSAIWWALKKWIWLIRNLVGAQEKWSGWSAIWCALRPKDLADLQFGGCSEKKIWLIQNLVGAQKNRSGWSAIWWVLRKKDLADPQRGGRSKQKIWLIRNLVGAQKIDLAQPQFGGCSKKKIWLICKTNIRSGGRVWACPPKKKIWQISSFEGLGFRQPPKQLFSFYMILVFRKSLWLGG